MHWKYNNYVLKLSMMDPSVCMTVGEYCCGPLMEAVISDSPESNQCCPRLQTGGCPTQRRRNVIDFCRSCVELGTRGVVLHHSAGTVLCFRNHVFCFLVLCCFLKVSAAGKDDLPMVYGVERARVPSTIFLFDLSIFN